MPQASLLSFFTATAQPEAISKKDVGPEQQHNASLQKGDLEKPLQPPPPEPEEKKELITTEIPGKTDSQPSIPADRLEFTLPNNPSITITSVTTTHLPALARLTTNLLPIKYPPSFYTEVTEDPACAAFSSVAIFTSRTESATPIGWLRCSLHPVPSPYLSPQTSQQVNDLYIKALLVHPAYRTLGIATSFLRQILSNTAALSRSHIASVSAHVWEENTEALEWYAKRGFERSEFIEGYYRRLKPAGAWVVKMDVKMAGTRVGKGSWGERGEG